MTADLDKAVERLTDMAEFFEDATDPFIAESVCKEHAADLRWSLSELSRLREENAALTRSVERRSPCGRCPTISNKALQAACDAYANCNICEADPMRAALSAALPVMLEGKREEIARVIDPDGYWERLDSCNHALATVQMNDDQRHALTKVRDDELRCTAESLAKADRIIAMLGGGE